MFRFLFRLMAMVALAVATIMAVLDATRTIAASELVLTPLRGSWNAVSPSSLDGFRAFVAEHGHPLIWDPVIASVLNQPGFVLFGLLALLLYAIGRRPKPRARRFAFEN